MSASYHTFTMTRTTAPDRRQLLTQLRALDATVGVQYQPPTVDKDGQLETPTLILKKATPWSPAQITAAQNVIETAPVTTPQSTAQAAIDDWPIELRAAMILIMEQFNTLRAAQSPPLSTFTPAQFLNAIRNKAAQL